MTDAAAVAVSNPYVDKGYPPTLTLEWLVDNKLPVFVRNTTRPRGQIAVNFPGPHGRVKVIKIPRTHLPIHLNAQMSYETIITSDDLRQCIFKGVIDLVRPDLAWTELQDPDNQVETDRMQLSQFSAKQAFVSKRVQDMEKTVDNRVDPSAPQLQTLGVETQVINPRIMRFVERMRAGDLPIKEAIGELKTMASELQATDCSYIIANGPHGQVRNYVQKVLAKIHGQQLEEQSFDTDEMPVMTPEEQTKEAQRESLARQGQVVR